MIVLEHVTKRFDSLVALDNVSLHCEAGRTHVLLGSSGCGKSTLLRLILGLLRPDAGEVRVDGTVVHAVSSIRLVKSMGYVVQEGGLYPHLTAYRNVTLPAEVQKWPTEQIRARVKVLAEMVGFDDAILRHYPNQLSGGQRQRVGLIRSLMLDPPLLLLDEPLGALDPVVRADLQRQLKDLFTTLHKTVVLVTHDLREAAVFGDTITLMTAGRVVQQGAFADLALRPSEPFVAAFLQAQKPPPGLKEYF
ncbi:Choline transport ATP-binding protein OpuBA [Candidatus Entotheonellaceae bacterium PAL068K]